MARALLVGATGLVGRELLQLLQSDPQITAIVAPTRTPLPPHGKLTNPVGDALFELLSSLQQPVDLVFCCWAPPPGGGQRRCLPLRRLSTGGGERADRPPFGGAALSGGERIGRQRGFHLPV